MPASKNRRLIVSQEVREAFVDKKAVVALESTVITHGLPYPDNVNTQKDLEQCVRDNGAVPASIAVIDGVVRVGLDENQLERLASFKAAEKISRRDLCVALSKKLTGGTTVATTMLIAKEAGIRVFATGGIGGVHRGAELSFDISADLEELANTSVCVVCAGAKAVLDIPKTLEILETKGVPVLGYQCDEVPAFYYRNSGCAVSARMESTKEIAQLLIHKWNLFNWPDGLPLEGGVLVVNPIAPEDELNKEIVEAHIQQAIAEMTLTGYAVTPYLLKRVAELSEGKSKRSNMSLLRGNAKLAAQIACDMR
jgi:pseudouridylate synthase